MEFTKLSSKGQVVIPQNIRDQLELKEGTTFVVRAKDNSVMLEKIEIKKPKTWDEVSKPFREAAATANLTEADVEQMIKKARRFKHAKNSQ